MKLKHSRDKKREFRQTLKDYDKGDCLDSKKAWREKRNWNEYMRRYRKKHTERIREQNRTASRRYRKRAPVKRKISKKTWQQRQSWNKYMREYRRIHSGKIKEQNRATSKKYRNKARQ